MTKQAKLILLTFLVGVFITFFITRACGEEVDIPTIIQIESSGNPHAYNAKSGAIGLMQITPICLGDWNNYTSKILYSGSGEPYMNQPIWYSLADLYNPKINIEIGTWYINTRIPQMLKHYGIEDTVRNRLISYHDGIGNLRKYLAGKRKLGKEMRGYLKKYERFSKD